MAFFKREKPTEPTPAPEVLGSVRTSSGEVMLFDFGDLALWSGDQPPHIPDGRLDPKLTASMNNSGDFEIVGPDAVAVGVALDLAAVHGRYAFDIPEPGWLQRRLDQAGYALHAVAIARMPHRQRVRRLLDDRPGGCEIPFYSNVGTAIRGVPVGVELPVLGLRMPADSDHARRWHSVWLECAPGPVERSVPIGYVFVDEARLMFADPDALSDWRSDVSVDGRADLVFWGRDAERVAAEVGAGPVDEPNTEAFGWLDQPWEDVAQHARRLARRRDAETVFAFDFRPHDDHHRILSSMRRSTTESGTLAVGDDQVVGFFTSWGDGAFPVYREEAADGRLLRVRVELGSPETIERHRRMEELWFGELSKLAVASPHVAAGRPIGWLERDIPRNDRDSGWCVYSGDETDAELDEPGAAQLISLRELIERQPDLEAVFTTPAPATFELAPDGSWVRIPDQLGRP